MAADVIDLVEQQARPWIERAKAVQPLIRDSDIDRMLASRPNLRNIKAELFRMVTLDPQWVAEAVASNKASAPTNGGANCAEAI